MRKLQKPALPFEGKPAYCPFHPKPRNKLRGPWKLYFYWSVDILSLMCRHFTSQGAPYRDTTSQFLETRCPYEIKTMSRDPSHVCSILLFNPSLQYQVFQRRQPIKEKTNMWSNHNHVKAPSLFLFYLLFPQVRYYLDFINEETRTERWNDLLRVAEQIYSE